MRFLARHHPVAVNAVAGLFASALLVAGCGATSVGKASSAGPSGTGVQGSASDRDVTFLVDGTVTRGTIHTPAHAAGAKVPAVLLLPGSGPTDRDGNQAQSAPNTLAHIAQAMGEDGIMTLRYDKYGTGQTGLGAYTGKSATLDLAAFVRQASAAYALLAGQSDADPRKLLIAGHSEGGMIALKVAQTAAPTPAGLALLEPQAERVLDTVNRQVDAQVDAAVDAGRLSSAQGATSKTSMANAVANLRAGRAADTSGLPAGIGRLVAGFNAIAAFVRSDDAVYPPDLGRRLTAGTKVIVTCGTDDVEIPCSTVGALVTSLAAAGSGGPGLVTLPGVNHLLQSSATASDASPLAPVARDALRRFDELWR